MTLLLRHDDLVDLMELPEVIAVLRDALREQAAGRVQLPPRTTVDSSSGRGWLRLMPVVMNGSKIMGYKAMQSTPGVGVRYLVSVIDMDTGEILAFVDADRLTQLRTAATAAIGTDALARPRIERAAVIGSSSQAEMLVAAVSHVRHIPCGKVFSPIAEHRERFARSARQRWGIDMEPAASAEEAIRGSDLVLSAFRASTTPMLQAAWLEAGTHVTGISSVRPEAREVEAGVWAAASAIGVDDREHVFESGDGRNALAEGTIRPGDAAELWEILEGTRPGRRRDEDVTLFKSVGTGLQDLAVAHALYRRAKAASRGQDLGAFPRARR